MTKIGIFYGPTGGSTEKVAMRLAVELDAKNIEMELVKNADAANVQRYDNIIFGISTIGKETWNTKHSINDWDKFFPELDKIDFSKKKVAMFGLGDSVQYGKNFVDALGTLYKKLIEKNADIIGQVSTDGYSFEESEGLIDDKFVGLPIDEDFEEEKTAERIKKWAAEIKPQFI